jgi:hypothetical protein
MRTLALILALFAPALAQAQVTYSGDARFGVAYGPTDTNPAGGAQVLYGGRYNVQLAHTADNGVRFAFVVQIEAGNLPGNLPPVRRN